MLFLAVILLGAISFTRLPIDLLPDVSYPRIVIYSSYPEVAPAEVERLVTERIEGAVGTTPGAERVTSISREGVSLVTLRFAWGTNMDFAMLNVRERLDQVRGSLPELPQRPQILRVDPRSDPIMILSVAGDDLWETKELAENVFRRRLEQVDGVAQAQVAGGLDREIVVEVDATLLEAYELSIAQVGQAVDQANRAGSGGTILEGRTRFPMRTLGEFLDVAEIEDVVVAQHTLTSGASRTVRVRDIGRVEDGFADRESLARYNGREAVGLMVFKEAGANTVEVTALVEEVLELLRAEFPEVSVDVAQAQAGFISDSINNVVSALIFGGILAFLVLFLFLREPRYPVAVALAIPISVVGTFALMDAFGVSLNIMSLGGLALGVGMLVDNSIIVLENVFRHRESGAGAIEAAERGAEEVSRAIAAATFTTIAVFLPIIYVEGVAGELFRDLSLAVAFSLLVSLLVALTLLPAIAARFRVGAAPETRAPGPLRPGPMPPRFFATVGWSARIVARFPAWVLGWLRALGRELIRFWWGGLQRGASRVFRTPLRAFDRAFDGFAARYHRLLEWSLDHRAVVLGVSALVLGVTALAAATLDRDLLPRVDQGGFEVGLELSEGTALERTDEVARAIEAVLLADAEVEAVFGTVGRDVRRFATSDDASGLHTARFQVRLSEGSESDPAVERLRDRLENAAPDATVTILTGQATALGQILGGSEADIAVRIRSEDLDAAFAYAGRLQAGLHDADRVANVRVGSGRGHPQVEVRIRRDDVARYGLQSGAVATAVENGMRGLQASEFVAFDRRIPIMVQLPDSLRYDVATVERLEVEDVPLREVVNVQMSAGPAEIRREDQGRLVAVLADVRSGGLDGAIAEVEAAIAADPPPRELRVEVGGENEEMVRSFRDLAFAFGLALVLVYMILAAQFESFVHPATILAAVPLALIGAVLALLATGEGLNTMSLIGIVILVGIVVNDAIVKVDFIVRAIERGSELRQAILEAGRVRLRPIVMTTVTTVFGLTPMALGIGRGADLRAPLAIAVIGGLTIATLLTLIVVPVLFSLVEEARRAVTGGASSPGDVAMGSLAPGSGAPIPQPEGTP